MSATFAIKVFLEVIASLAVLYGIYRERDLVAFEDRIIASFRRQRVQKAAATQAQQATKLSAEALQQEEEMRQFYAREQRAREAAAARRAASRQKQKAEENAFAAHSGRVA